MKKLIALFSLICLLTVSTNSFAGGNDKKSKGKEKSCCQGKDAKDCTGHAEASGKPAAACCAGKDMASCPKANGKACPKEADGKQCCGGAHAGKSCPEHKESTKQN
jgi:hypothetical protein